MVRVNQDNPFWFGMKSTVSPVAINDPVVIAVDPGKTNMAVIVGHPAGIAYYVLQFSSPGRKNDSTTYCMEFKRFFRQFLENTTIFEVGIEAVISKKALNYHHSAKVLHEIRSQLIDVFYSDFGKRPEEVNNWAWKSYSLPEGFRGQSEKGSTRWYRREYAMYGSSDVTDAIGIYNYLIRDSKYTFPIKCKSPEQVYFKPDIRVVYSKPEQARVFDFNENYSIFSNAAYFVNRSIVPGVAKIPVDSLSKEDIERYCIVNLEEVYLFVEKA
jgi:hypothetical protein